MRSYWAAFATTGDPNGGGRPDWPAYRRSKKNDNFLGINSGTDVSAGDGVRTAFCDFWNSVETR